MLNLRSYSSLFHNRFGRIADNYIMAATENDLERIAPIGGRTDDIDTALEIALLSNATGVINIRPVQANEIMGTPKQADLKLGAAVYQEIQVLRFLASTSSATADTNAVGRYEGMLRFITDRGNVTRAEVEAFYRNGIRGLISEIVDEEFNKVSFRIENIINQQASSYGGVLTRNPQNGQYILSYERPDIQNSRKELSGQTLEALSSAISGSGDFSQAAINTVRAQAALIPAAVLSATALAEVTNIITRFYTEPNLSTYTALVETYRVMYEALFNTINIKYTHVSYGYERTLLGLNGALVQKVSVDNGALRSITILTREQQQRLVGLR